MQAILNATGSQDEFVKEQLVTLGKVRKGKKHGCFVVATHFLR